MFNTQFWLSIVMTAATVLLLGCGGGEHEEFTDCALGQLTGTWRFHYVETNGDCGPIADETVMMSAATEPTGSLAGAQISADRCRMDLAFTAATTDGQGTQTWTTVLFQTGPAHIGGTATVQINHPMGVCRSTYDVNVTKL